MMSVALAFASARLFSAFSADAVLLYERGAVSSAALYVLASVIASIAALLLGLFLSRT